MSERTQDLDCEKPALNDIISEAVNRQKTLQVDETKTISLELLFESNDLCFSTAADEQWQVKNMFLKREACGTVWMSRKTGNTGQTSGKGNCTVGSNRKV